MINQANFVKTDLNIKLDIKKLIKIKKAPPILSKIIFEQEKNIKIIAFGHKNYLAYALEKYFNNHTIKNCEAVSFNIDEENKITAEFNLEKKEIN